MILDRFLLSVEEIAPELFDELSGPDARRELSELRSHDDNIIRVNGETIADYQESWLEDVRGNRKTEKVITIILK